MTTRSEATTAARPLDRLVIPHGGFTVIYADPPWNYTIFDSKHGGRTENQYYKTMRAVDIFDLPVCDIAADNCALFLWATSPLLPEAIFTMKSWGFDYKGICFVWVKTNPKSGTPFFGMGQWTRANAEIVLLGIKGKPRRKDAGVSQIVSSPIGKHSEKPHEVREKIVQLMGDVPRIELFARKKFDGWTVWGNEV